MNSSMYGMISQANSIVYYGMIFRAPTVESELLYSRYCSAVNANQNTLHREHNILLSKSVIINKQSKFLHTSTS